MADKKPMNNTPAGEGKSSAAKNAGGTSPAGATIFGRRLGVGAVVGASVAGLALLIGAGAAGAAISQAVDHGGREHAEHGQAAERGQGDMNDKSQQRGGPDGEKGPGHGDGPRDGAMKNGAMKGDGRKGDGMKNGEMPHEHDANGNDIMPDGQIPPAPGTTPAP